MKSQMSIGKLGGLIITMVVLAVLATTFITQIPSYTQGAEQITKYSMTFEKEELPCLLNCYSRITGDTERLLKESNYLQLGESDKLIEYFHCNTEILELTTLLFELAKWTSLDPPQRYGEGDGETETLLNRAINYLYECVANNNCNNDREKNFLYFCDLDEYLSHYGYIDCSNRQTLNDFLRPSRMEYSKREGQDINNDFVCDKSLSDYLGPYDLCVPEVESKYTTNCQPAWKTLIEQEYKGELKTAKGRCEDFALLYKTLFSSLGVPEDDLTLTMGYCELSPYCLSLIDTLNTESIKTTYGIEEVSYELIDCVAPANLTINDWGVIEGCHPQYTINHPDEYFSEYILRVRKDDYNYVFNIKQPIVYYRNLSFNGNLRDDVRWHDDGVIREEVNRLWSTSGDLTNYGLIIEDGVITNLGSDKFYFGNLLNTMGSDAQTAGVSAFNKKPPLTYGLNFNLKSITECEESNITVRLALEGDCGFNKINDYLIREGESVQLQMKIEEGDVCLKLGRPLKPSIELLYNDACLLDYEISNWALMDYYIDRLFFNVGTQTDNCQTIVIDGVKIDDNGIESPATLSDLFN